MKIKIFLSIILVVFGMLCTVKAQKKDFAKLTIYNKSTTNFKGKVIEIPWAKVIEALPAIDTAALIIVDKKNNKQLVYQLEKRGSANVQNLLIQVSVPSKQSLILLIKKGKRNAFAAKTYARFVPERYDDFAWENDKIAFRMYGKALEATTFNAYGIDIWAKRTDKLVINNWYKAENYHEDSGEGLDFYGVGFSLGAGGIAPFYNGDIIFSKNYVNYKVLDNGPLRSTFTLFYDEWKVGNEKINVTKTIQLDAGSQLNKFEVVFSANTLDSLPIVAGIHKTKGDDVKMLDQKKGVLGYWEPTNSQHGVIGVGCVFLGNNNIMRIEKDHLINFVNLKITRPYTYYAGGAWDKAGEFKSALQWFNYLDVFSDQLTNPLNFTIE